MIFGKHSLIRVVFTHIFRLFSVTQLLRLVGLALISYEASRRTQRQRSVLGNESVMRRMHSHIVAQAIGVEKFLPAGAQRGRSPHLANLIGQLSVVSMVVLTLWVAFPQRAAAPNAQAIAAPAIVRQTALEPSEAREPVSLPLAASEPKSALSATGAPEDTSSAPQNTTDTEQVGQEARSLDELAASIAATRARLAALTAEKNAAEGTDGGDRTPMSLLAHPKLTDILHRWGIERLPEPAPKKETPPPPTPSADVLVQSIDQEQVHILDLFGALDQASTAPSEVAVLAQEALAALKQAAKAEAEAEQPAVSTESQQTAAAPAPAAEPEPVVVLTPGSAWASFTPGAPSEIDHLWLQSPFPEGYNQFYSPNYQFGSTASGRYRIHHGVDISNPAGAPILAPADGEVVHAGPDNPTLLGPYNNFYGNAVVIRLNRRLPTPEGDKDVYVLYGHMSEVYAVRGQQVAAGEPVGAVGMTGIAIGPHLHVEVRLGQNSYLDTVNPALWMQPVPGTGAVAVRLLDAQGRTWPQARLSLLRFEGDSISWVRTIEIYPEAENVSADPSWGENGAMNNLPAGAYYITGKINGEKVGQNLVINPGETTFVELRTQQ